jgi:hypothetical protein
MCYKYYIFYRCSHTSSFPAKVLCNGRACSEKPIEISDSSSCSECVKTKKREFEETKRFLLDNGDEEKSDNETL